MSEGCERDPPTWQHHKSLSTAWDRRYRITNPYVPDAFITIMQTENEFIPPDIVNYWERELQINIEPKPWETEKPRRTGPWSPPIN